MTAAEIADTRTRLGLTQLHLATLLGVAGSTVSRWERGGMPPDPAPLRLLLVLQEAPADVGARLTKALRLRGSLYALHVLLSDHITRGAAP